MPECVWRAGFSKVWFNFRGVMEPANRILECLYDRGEGFFALGELSCVSGVSGGHLEEALSELSQRGHHFERSPAQGVRLLRPTVMDAHLIERDLPVEHVGRHVICFKEVDSTNDVAFASASQAAGQALVVTAEYQRAGRGRLGRKWFSPPGSAVLASVLLHRQACELPHEALTLAAGLAVAEGLEEAAGVTAGLLWPNDVVIDEAKLAGVLVEVRAAAGERQVVIGFGINVGASPPREMLRDRPAEQVDRPATCLAEVLGEASGLERIEICRAVLVALDRWVSALQAERLEHLHDRWCSRCDMINRRLCVQSADRRLTGRVIDVNPTEGLILLTDDAHRLHLPAATSTVIA